MKTALLRKLIVEILKESLPPQHRNLKDNDLIIIGEKLVNKFESAGYPVQKSKNSFSNMCIFELGEDGRYLVSIKKKINFHLVEDSSIQVFNRNDPELSAFLKKVGNKNISKKSPQQYRHPTGKLNHSFDDENDETIYDLNDQNDETIFSGDKDKEVFKTKFAIEYIITFQDMLKTGNTFHVIKNKFISNTKDNIEKNTNFNIFSEQLALSAFNRFTTH